MYPQVIEIKISSNRLVDFMPMPGSITFYKSQHGQFCDLFPEHIQVYLFHDCSKHSKPSAMFFFFFFYDKNTDLKSFWDSIYTHCHLTNLIIEPPTLLGPFGAAPEGLSLSKIRRHHYLYVSSGQAFNPPEQEMKLDLNHWLVES